MSSSTRWLIAVRRLAAFPAVFSAVLSLVRALSGGVLAAGAGVASAQPEVNGATNTTCKMTTTFPDGSRFVDACVMRILPAGQDSNAPKGSVQFLDATRRNQVFSLNFYPPKQIKPNVPYTLTTDSMDSFLNGIVQQTSAHQLCRMNKRYATSGTVTFTAVGAAPADYHGTVQVYPACYVRLGTPQESLVPGGPSGGGATTVTF
jgi:hypothetical protein